MATQDVLTEHASATAAVPNVTDRIVAEIAQACRAHEDYLAAYGSLADALRADANASEPA